MKGLRLLLTLSGLLVSAAHAQAPADAEPPVETPASEPTDITPPPAAEVPIVEESVDPALLAPPGGGEAQMSEEELKALGFGSETESSVDTSLKFFGFADFSVFVIPTEKDNGWRASNRHASFYLGNVNLFFSKNFSENVRTLGEVRFLFAPHGSANFATGSLIENAAGDHNDFQRTVHWGGIEIERLYLEWQLHTYLALRTGMFLTPYGIWNVDHGSPLYIPVRRPYVVGSALFPERQTGFEFLGKREFGEHSAIGYHLTLSNGTGPVTEVADLDDNKAVGGRVFWDYRRLGQLRIGGSIYYGRDTAATMSQGFANGRLTFLESVSRQYDALGLAADVQWKIKGLHLQAELITQQVRYTKKGRVGAVSPITGQPLFSEDDLGWGVYGLAGYRTEWIGLMPYVVISRYDRIDYGYMDTKNNGFTFGLNAQPLDGVVVKLEYFAVFWPGGNIISDDNYHSLQFQLAWAF